MPEPFFTPLTWREEIKQGGATISIPRDGIKSVTEDEAEDARRSLYIHELQEAFFSNLFFDMCPISNVHKRETVAAKLLSDLHCKKFKLMNDNTKKTLWKAALEINSIQPEEFPYPFSTPEKEVKTAIESISRSFKSKNALLDGFDPLSILLGMFFGVCLFSFVWAFWGPSSHHDARGRLMPDTPPIAVPQSESPLIKVPPIPVHHVQEGVISPNANNSSKIAN